MGSGKMAKAMSLGMIWNSFELVKIEERVPCGMMSANCELEPSVWPEEVWLDKFSFNASSFLVLLFL